MAWLQMVVATGTCQVIISNEALHNQVFIGVGLEPEWVATVGYLYGIGKPGKPVDFQLGVSIKLPPLLVAQNAWRANLMVAAHWRMAERWSTQITGNIYNAHDYNRAGVMNGIGFEMRAAPAYDGKHWRKGFDIGWQYTALTHIRHSAEAKDTFKERYAGNINGIEGPKNGWYGATASRFRLGFIGARKLGDHLTWQLGLGGLISVQRQGIWLGFSHAQVPFYLQSTWAYRW